MTQIKIVRHVIYDGNGSFENRVNEAIKELCVGGNRIKKIETQSYPTDKGTMAFTMGVATIHYYVDRPYTLENTQEEEGKA